MTSAAPGQVAIEPAAIAALLRDLTGASAREVRPLRGGISNFTYLVRLAPPADPATVIVRVLANRERARAERAALGVLESAEVPAPRLLGHAHVPGAGWIVVSTRMPGRPAARPNERAWLDGLAGALAAIHGITGHGRGLSDDPGPERTWIDEEPAPDLGRFAQEFWPEIARRRKELALGPAVLVHGDFHAGNVHWVGRRLAGVIDWEMARWGPAAADVAYCYLDLVLAAGERVAKRFRAAYVERAGDVAGFEAWLALATVRPLPDPAGWLPSYDGAGWRGLTPMLLRRRLTSLAHSLASSAP